MVEAVRCAAPSCGQKRRMRTSEAHWRLKTAADADATDVWIALDLTRGALDCDREGGCAKREGEGDFGQMIGVDHGGRRCETPESCPIIDSDQAQR